MKVVCRGSIFLNQGFICFTKVAPRLVRCWLWRRFFKGEGLWQSFLIWDWHQLYGYQVTRKMIVKAWVTHGHKMDTELDNIYHCSNLKKHKFERCKIFNPKLWQFHYHFTRLTMVNGLREVDMFHTHGYICQRIPTQK